MRQVHARQSLAYPNVEMVHRASSDPDQNLVLARLRVGDVFVAENFRTSKFVDANGFHESNSLSYLDAGGRMRPINLTQMPVAQRRVPHLKTHEQGPPHRLKRWLLSLRVAVDRHCSLWAERAIAVHILNINPIVADAVILERQRRQPGQSNDVGDRPSLV